MYQRKDELSVVAAARALGVRYRTARNWIRVGRLRGGYRRQTRHWYVKAASVAALLGRRGAA
jgi:predicted site-specific integrase-resolvase